MLDGSDWAAGCICQIFSLPSLENTFEEEFFVYAKEYARAPSGVIPRIMQEFPMASGKLFSTETNLSIVLQLDEVIGQFCLAETDYGPDIFHAIPMEKVYL